MTRKTSTMLGTSSWTLQSKVVRACGGRFRRRRGACEDSSELSSFNGSPVPGDDRWVTSECFLLGCDLPLSGLSAGASVSKPICGRMPNSAASFLMMQNCQVLRHHYNLVCLGLTLTLLSVFVAHRCSVLSLFLIKDGVQQYGEGCGG